MLSQVIIILVSPFWQELSTKNIYFFVMRALKFTRACNSSGMLINISLCVQGEGGLKAFFKLQGKCPFLLLTAVFKVCRLSYEWYVQILIKNYTLHHRLVAYLPRNIPISCLSLCTEESR